MKAVSFMIRLRIYLQLGCKAVIIGWNPEDMIVVQAPLLNDFDGQGYSQALRRQVSLPCYEQQRKFVTF